MKINLTPIEATRLLAVVHAADDVVEHFKIVYKDFVFQVGQKKITSAGQGLLKKLEDAISELKNHGTTLEDVKTLAKINEDAVGLISEMVATHCFQENGFFTSGGLHAHADAIRFLVNRGVMCDLQESARGVKARFSPSE